MVVPRTKKAPGQAVDRRNGRKLALAGADASALDWFVLPERRPDWSPEARMALAALRADQVANLLSPVDGPVVLRWLDCLDRAAVCLRRADRRPVVRGGNGQETEHPSYGTAKAMLAEAARCEAQIGIGALNRNHLGIEFAKAQASLEDLNERLRRPRVVAGEVVSRRDPRLSAVSGDSGEIAGNLDGNAS